MKATLIVFVSTILLMQNQCPNKRIESFKQNVQKSKKLVLDELEIDTFEIDAYISSDNFIPVIELNNINLRINIDSLEDSMTSPVSFSLIDSSATLDYFYLNKIKQSNPSNPKLIYNPKIGSCILNSVTIRFINQKNKRFGTYKINSKLTDSYQVLVNKCYVNYARVSTQKQPPSYKMQFKDRMSEKIDTAREALNRTKEMIYHKIKQFNHHVVGDLIPSLMDLELDLGIIDNFLDSIADDTPLKTIEVQEIKLNDILNQIRKHEQAAASNNDTFVAGDGKNEKNFFYDSGKFRLSPNDLGSLKKFVKDLSMEIKETYALNTNKNIEVAIKVVGYADSEKPKESLINFIQTELNLGKSSLKGIERRMYFNKKLSKLRANELAKAFLNEISMQAPFVGNTKVDILPLGEEIPDGLLNPKEEDYRRRKAIMTVMHYVR